MTTSSHAQFAIRDAHDSDMQSLVDFVKENNEDLNIAEDDLAAYITDFALALTSAQDLVLLARVDKDVVGFAIVTRGKSASRRHAAQLRLYVTGAERGQDIGSALIGRVLDWAHSEGVLRVEATPYIDRNENGRPSTSTIRKLMFFNKHGFASEGLMLSAARRLPDTIVDTMMMAWVDEEEG